METDEKGVKRQKYLITHINAVEGLDTLTGNLSDVKSVNGKSGNVTLALSDLGITNEMLNTLKKMIEAYDNGTLGNGDIELEKVEEE